MTKKIINVNRYNIERNKKKTNDLPVITVFDGFKEDHFNEVIILGQDGKEAARIKYSRDKPIRPHISVWIETENEVKTL